MSIWSIFENQDQVECLNKANASPQVAAIDNLISDLNKNWKPTGYYRPADIRRILDTLATQAAAAGDAVAKAPSSTGDAETSKAMAFDDLLTKYKDRSQTFEKAVAQAHASGATAINAPSLKEFVIASMRAISDAYVTAAVLQCRQTWLQSILDAAYSSLMAIGSVAYDIVGVAISAGEAVVDASETAIKIISFIVKAAPWVAVAVGGYVGYGLVTKHWPHRRLVAAQRE